MIEIPDKHYKWSVVVTVGVGVLASTLDGSIVNLAYPVLTDVLSTDPSTVLWVTVAYLLVSASLALPLGALGDILGRKRIYTLGFFIFTIGLGLSAVSQSIGQLIAFRVIQGIGQGMMVSTSNALIVGAFPNDERGKVLGINGALVGVGLASGPVLGGVILDFMGWRALFWSRLPVSVIGLLVAILVLRTDTNSGQRRQFDYLGTITLIIGLSCLLLFINRVPLDGLSIFVIALGLISGLGLICFVFIERRVGAPVFDMALLKQRLWVMAVTSSFLQFLAQAALLFLMPFYLLQGLGLRPLEAGPILMTLPLTRLVVSPLSGILSDRFQSRNITTFGLLIMVVGYLFLLGLDAESSIPEILFGLTVAGIGNSTFLPANNSVVMGSVTRERLGMVSAVIPLVRQVGISLGIAITGTMYSVREAAHRLNLASAGANEADQLSGSAVAGYADGFQLGLVLAFVAVLLSALRGKDKTSKSGATLPNSDL